MRIERLRMHRVGPFEDLDLKLQPCRDDSKADIHVLVGPNGSGKSTILRALAQMLTVTDVPVASRMVDEEAWIALETDQDTLVACGRRGDGNPLEIRLPGDLASAELFGSQSNVGGLVVKSSADHRTDQRQEALLLSQKPTIRRRFSWAPFAYSGYRSTKPVAITAIQEPQTSPLAGALSFDAPPNTDALIQWIANSRTKEALALQDSAPAEAARWRSSVALIEETLSEVTDRSVRFRLERDPLNVKLQVDGTAVPFDTLPDGLRSLLSWIADLMMRMDRLAWVDDLHISEREFFLFLDEVEVHLHPAWQRQVLPVVQKLFPKAQVFISTHSPYIVASASDAWIYPLDVVGGRAVALAPLESRRGYSYSAILDHVFGIDDDFDVETVDLLDEFRRLRDLRLGGDRSVQEDLEKQANTLATMSPELQTIIGREMRVLRKRVQ